MRGKIKSSSTIQVVQIKILSAQADHLFVGLAGVLLAFLGGTGLVDKLTPFRSNTGERLGDRPLPAGAALAAAASSFSGEVEEPVPVAELRLEFVKPTVVSKWRNL